MSGLLTLAIWAVFGGFYAAAVSFAVTDLVRRFLPFGRAALNPTEGDGR